MGMDKESWAKKGDKAFSTQPAFMYLCSFDFEGKNEWYFKQIVSIPTKLTKTLSKSLSEMVTSPFSSSNVV